MQRCAAITTEFENVPAPALRTLGAHLPVAPGAESVAIAQDRIKEKAHFVRCGVPCAPYAVLQSEADLTSVAEALLPGILKTARLGYDGRGQVRVRNRAELAAAWASLQGVPCVLEQLLPLQAEVSVIVARGWDGAMVNYPPQANLHRDGILAVTSVYEGNLAPALAQQAIEATKSIANGLSYVGVLCVEFFVLQDGTLIVNEMAPRPHNSGHYTLDACDVSQFELQVRTLVGLPLAAPRLHSPAIMLNLLGDLWLQRSPDFAHVLALPGAHLHLYGKLQPKPGRKMGHMTLTAATVAQVQAKALAACRLLGIEPLPGWLAP
jgi:5-(carboxyamino)imidazole ribonucleotide synthase